MDREFNVITCPKCGREYLPAEIFIPNSFFGNPDIIKRDEEGKIVKILGTSLDTEESYCCDLCHTAFKVSADVSFVAEIDVKNDFSSDYVSKMKPRFNLRDF